MYMHEKARHALNLSASKMPAPQPRWAVVGLDSGRMVDMDVQSDEMAINHCRQYAVLTGRHLLIRYYPGFREVKHTELLRFTVEV